MRLRFTDAALRDIARILKLSRRAFGLDARNRYRNLMDRAVQEIAQDPARAGVRVIDERRGPVFGYHLKQARQANRSRQVIRPRHVLIYRCDESGLTVLRILHERQLLSRHLE